MMEVPDENDISNNPYIWSREIAINERSFVDKRQKYNRYAPPPKYLTR